MGKLKFFKKFKKHKLQTKIKVFVLLGIVNSVLAVMIASAFSVYVNKNQTNDYMDDVEMMKKNSAQINEQISLYLRRQQTALDGIYTYLVEETDFSEDEVLEYMERLKTLPGALSLISCSDYKGYLLDVNKEEYLRVADYSEVEQIKEICDRAVQGDFYVRDGGMLDVVLDGVRQAVIFRPIIAEKQTYLLMYGTSLGEIFEECIVELEFISKTGFLMDETGEILFGIIPKELGEGFDNFYDFLAREYDEETFTGARDIIFGKDKGTFTLMDKEKPEWLVVYETSRDMPGWTYVEMELKQDPHMTSYDMGTLLLIIIGLILLACVDYAVIFWQNQNLKRNLRIIEEKNKELEEANQAKNNFISNMSHEIRTPINAVLGMDEMILRESNEENIREYAENIRSAGRTLLGIINDILDFSKIDSGKMEVIPGEYEVGSVVNDLLNMIEVRAKDKHLDFYLRMNETIPHLLYGDELRIKQIILNILTNAVKYTDKGNVTFSLDYEKKADDKILLKVSVKDTGIGIKPEEKEKLFQPFERIDEKRNRTIEGTGLGMSIVLRLLYQMGSELNVESVYGEGSEFSFVLEQNVIDWKPVGNMEKLHELAKQGNGENGVLFVAPKAKILVVDDTPINLTVVRGLLKRTKIQVDGAQSGFEGLEMLAKKKYDLLFLDHRMPEMDGIETLHRLKESDGMNRNIPAIALTANVVSGAAERYMKEGFCDFLPKPVSGTRLERMILKYLPEELIEEPEESEALDSEAGMAACGSEDVLKEVRKEFAETAETRIKEIAGYFEAGDIKNYTIKVHALKSSARLVGATKLSADAAHLEECGDAGNTEEILEKTGKLLSDYRELANELKAQFTEKEAETKPEISEEELKEALVSIGKFNEEFDFDNMDAVMLTLSDYRMPGEAEKLFSELKQAVLDVNQEKIAELIQGYVGGREHE